jgi:predicted amidophosphoribosyltransferase
MGVSGGMRVAAVGAYVPSRELAHTGHELSQRIRESKLWREHDPLFARLLAQSAARHFPGFRPDLVVSLPPKPSRDDRFRNVRRELAARLGAADGGGGLSLTRLVSDYRRMSAAQRLAAAAGIHLASGSVRARSVMLIDDVVASGAQAGDAIRALRAAGATDVRFACLARTIGSRAGPPRRRIATAALECAGLAALSAGAVGCVRG